MSVRLRSKLLLGVLIELLLLGGVGLAGACGAQVTLDSVHALVDHHVREVSLLGELAADVDGVASDMLLHALSSSPEQEHPYEQEARAPGAAPTGLTTAQTGTSATTTSAGPITAGPKSVPVTISRAGSACQSGPTSCTIDHYVLQQSINGLAFAPVTLASPTATSVTLNLSASPTNNSQPATTYRYEVQAVDKAGNASAFTVAAPFTVPDTDNSLSSSFAGGWSGVNLTGAFGGSVQQSSTANATAQPANAARASSLALVSTLGPDRGEAQIKVDGRLMAMVDLSSPTQTAGQVVWSINGLAPVSTTTSRSCPPTPGMPPRRRPGWTTTP